MSKRDLWKRIHQYHFEHVVPPQLMDRVAATFGGRDASTQAFAGKLALKHGGARRFWVRAIEEYKKFIYLGTVGDAPVTPSKVIDTVWHEHILFSRAYREFCRDVLGRDFDHNPELLPIAEQNDVFARQYLDTLDAYRTEFNAMPPSDVWSVPKFRSQELKRAPKKLEQARRDAWGDETPLYVYYGSGDSSASESSGFGGGGDFSGGGSDRSWGDSDSNTDSGSDSASLSSGSDSGGSDGGSSCSSSCGGGGGE